MEAKKAQQSLETTYKQLDGVSQTFSEYFFHEKASNKL